MSFFFELLSSLLILLPFSSLVTAYQYQTCDESRSNYTTNSTFDANLQLILQSLYSNTSTTGFFNDTKGLGADQVYGLAMCRGDVSAADCQPCLNTSVEQIVQNCPNYKAATIWEDDCLVRYSDENFFGKISAPTGFPYNVNNVTNTTLFNQELSTLLDGIIERAAYGPRQLSYPLLFAVNETSYSTFSRLYGLVQCTRDLSKDDCNKCLTDQLQYIPIYFNGRIGARVLSGSCFLRYESAAFYKASQPLQQAPPPALQPPDGRDEGGSDTGKKKNSNTTIILATILGSLGVLTFLFLFWCIKRKKTMDYGKYYDSVEIVDNESRIFHLSMIKLVTNDFSEANMLGAGGFGSVYKGTLEDGRDIAVKRLSTNSKQGIEEFKNEISLLIKLQHRNLLQILGFCLEEGEKLIIYEYMDNKSLDKILKDPIKRQQLHWEKRYNIIGGIAKGLLYLHEESQVKIIHRDLKASNILLDSELNPKIADFGLARMFDTEQTRAITKRIAGTLGYMAPEYVRRGHFSSKSDIYSFGVLVLEIVTGRMNNNDNDEDDEDDLLTYVWEHWCKKSISDIVDPTINSNYPMDEALRCIEIALLCLQEAPGDRIDISTVILILSGYSASFVAPAKPAFLPRSIGGISINEGTSSSVDTRNHVLQDMDGNELSITDLTVR